MSVVSERCILPEPSVVTIEAIRCGNCNFLYGLPSDFIKERISDGKRFYCPNGHHIYYSETEIKKLKRRLEFEQRQQQLERGRREQAEEETLSVRRSLISTKGVLTKERKRIANGVCPKCNRTFANLARHIKCKHPKILIHS